MTNMQLDIPFHYLLREPKKSSSHVPVVLMLHGYGSHEGDLFSFADSLPEECCVIALRAPLRLDFGGYAWYEINWQADGNKWTNLEQAEASIALLNTTIDALKVQLQFEKWDLHLFGFSQGAILSYALAFRFPDKIKYVEALSGYMVKELIPEQVPTAVQKLDFFISHGNMDPVIPIQWGKTAADILESAKISHTFREYPMAHGVTPQCFNDLLAWMKERMTKLA